MLTEPEKVAIDKSADLWNYYMALPQIHPDDMNDFRFHIHAIQNIIMARDAARNNHDIFREFDNNKNCDK